MPDDYLTVKDVMTTLKIGQTKAYQVVNQEGFPARRIGRAIRIRRDEFHAWVAEQNRNDPDWLAEMVAATKRKVG